MEKARGATKQGDLQQRGREPKHKQDHLHNEGREPKDKQGDLQNNGREPRHKQGDLHETGREPKKRGDPPNSAEEWFSRAATCGKRLATLKNLILGYPGCSGGPLVDPKRSVDDQRAKIHWKEWSSRFGVCGIRRGGAEKTDFGYPWCSGGPLVDPKRSEQPKWVWITNFFNFCTTKVTQRGLPKSCRGNFGL